MGTIRIPDAITFIREHPGMYICLDERPLAQRLLLRLINDALALNVWDLSVSRSGQWIFVGSNTDWLRMGKFQKASPIELFSGPMPFLEGGANACRSEAVLRALAEKVLVFGPEGYEFLEPYGKAEPEEPALAACEKLEKLRVVGFRGPAE